MSDLLTKPELHGRFISAVGDSAVVDVSTDAADELVLQLQPPLPTRVRVYLRNATDPPGGRSTPEHKIQLTGQRRGQRGSFNWFDVDLVLVCGYAVQHDVFIFWDAAVRPDFAYSTSLEVKSAHVLAAAASRERVRQDRRLQTGLEVVICAPSWRVAEAIAERASNGEVGSRSSGLRQSRGQPYMRPQSGGSVTSESRVFRVDPDVIDRGTKAHWRIQNQLADAVSRRGWEPRSPSESDPLFDVGWIASETAWIAEVKSLTHANEERQLRLGLGQVLSYAHLVDWSAMTTRAVLAVERQPSSPYWPELCASHGVALSWPEVFEDLLDSCAQV